MNGNFYDLPPDPSMDPTGFVRQQLMADQLTKRGTSSPAGKMVNGNFVAPSEMSYATQLGNALAGGYKNSQLRDASRANNILNGGTGESGLSKLGTAIGSIFGGGR